MTEATVHFAGESYSLATLRTRGARAAQTLARRGVAADDIVALLLRNEPTYVEALTCIRCLGARRVLLPWHLTATEIGQILQEIKPTVLIGHLDLLTTLQPEDLHIDRPPLLISVPTPAVIERLYGATSATHAAIPPADCDRWDALIDESPTPMPIPDRPLQVISLTSGTTGRPKAIHWDRSPPWTAWADRRTQQRPPIRTSIVTAPLYHGGQYGAFSHACHKQAAQVIMPKFEPEQFLRLVEQYRVNHAYMVPTMFVRLLKLPAAVRRRYDVSSLTYVLHTGAACAPDVKRRMIDWWGPVIWEAYGCSELSVIAACSSIEWLQRPGTVGRPHHAVRILRSDGTPCPAGEAGEVFVRAEGLPTLRSSSGTSRHTSTADGQWLSPGDNGYLDGAGYLYIVGRRDDLINTGRVKVYPLEIENAILQHEGVRDCFVFAIPDAEFGQIIGAAVEMGEHTAGLADELRRFLAPLLSEHKIPAVFVPLNPGARAATGKLDRTHAMQHISAAARDVAH